MRPWCDQIVIVDTGSTDGTQELAAELADVFKASERFTPDTKPEDFRFDAARNEALKLCTCDWVLSIDADERLIVVDPDAFRADMASHADTWDLPIAGERAGEFVFRLWRRSKQREWVLPIHEVMVMQDGVRNSARVMDSAYLQHTGEVADKAKRRRNLLMLRRWFDQFKVRRWLYYVAHEANLAGDPVLSLGAARAYLDWEGDDQPEPDFCTRAVRMAEANAMLLLKMYDGMIDAGRDLIRDYPADPGGYMVMGDALANKRQWHEAKEAYIEGFGFKPPANSPVGYSPEFYDAGFLLQMLGRVDFNRGQQARLEKVA